MADVIDLLEEAVTELKEGKMPSSDLLQGLLTKGLSYGLVLGGAIVKLPQLIAVVSAGSADGIAPMAVELETVATTVQSVYAVGLGLPFSAYGESALLTAQNVLLALLVYHFSKLRGRLLLAAAIFAAFLAAWALGHVPAAAVQLMYELNNLTVIFSRVPQIYQNYKAGSTGQLSGITTGLMTAGGLARIFTTIKEGGGAAMVRAYAIGATLNLILLTQIVVLGAGKKRAPRGKQAKRGRPKQL
ncbi:unnamed protein product [Pedinophyceae sp. YPF-701]|nr:unnamed protein product [Pedinophyceae sp. YPF-701]